MKLKRHIRYTKNGSSIGFTGAALRKQPRCSTYGAITGCIEGGEVVSWLARICYRFGARKLARLV